MKVFLDTNVLAYRADLDDPKQPHIERALRALTERPWVSTQVLLELHDVLIRKLGRTRQEAQVQIEQNQFHVEPADAALIYAAAETATKHQLRIYDSMILEAAARAGCDELWTEDFNHGSTLRGVRIVNPFLS